MTPPLPASPLITRVASGATWYRCHWRDRAAPYFNRAAFGSRFNSTSGDFGTLYLAESIEGAFVEGLVYDVTLKGGPARVVSDELLRNKVLSVIAFPTALRLFDLTGRGLALAERDLRLLSCPHTESCPFAEQVFAHADAYDGIRYPSRHNPNLSCVALFERPREAPEVVLLGSWLSADLLSKTQSLMTRYQITRAST